MPKYRISWTEQVTQYWDVEVIVDSEEEAKALFESGRHVERGEPFLLDVDINKTDLNEIERIDD